jgi:flagellin-like protein
MRKGLTDVVTLVLLLLMAVAAVGGAYIWFGRFQSSTQERVGSEMKERVEGQMGTQVIISAVFASETGASSSKSPLSENENDDYSYWCTGSSFFSTYTDVANRGTQSCDSSIGKTPINLLIQNVGTQTIKASSAASLNDLGTFRVLIDGKPAEVHIDNATIDSYNITDFTAKSMGNGDTRTFHINYTCAEIGLQPDGKIKIEVVPRKGQGASTELTCIQCCSSLTTNQAACETYCE